MKTLNVLGIVFAWIISIVLVVALVVTPVVMSAMSLLNPKTLTAVLTETLTAEPRESADASGAVDGAEIMLLATDSDTATKNDSAEALITPEMVKDLLGVEVDEKGLKEVLASDPMQEVLSAYTEDLTNVITGDGEAKFNGDEVKKIVNKNLDEIVEVLQKVSPELAEKSVEELRDQIRTTVEDKADSFVEVLPNPEEVKEDLVNEVPVAEDVLNILAKKNLLKWGLIGALVVLAVIIFFLRFRGFRGLRWLAVDLFVAAGIGAVVCVALVVISPIVLASLEKNGVAAVSALLSAVIATLTSGLIWRYAVMLGAGVVLLVGYIVLKRIGRKSAAVEVSAEEPVALEESVDTEEPVAVEAPAEETEVAEETTAEEAETV